MDKSEYIKLQERSSAWTSESKVFNYTTGKMESWGRKVENYYMLFAHILNDQLYDDDVVVDIGCGDGSSLYRFSVSNACTPLGIDLSKEKLAFCNQNFRNITTICCLMEDIPLEDKSVDHVFCSHTLEHSYDMDEALREINRITKHLVFIAVPLENEDMATLNSSHKNFSEDPAWWLKRFKKAGLKQINYEKPLSFMISYHPKTKKRMKPGYDLVYWGLAT